VQPRLTGPASRALWSVQPPRAAFSSRGAVVAATSPSQGSESPHLGASRAAQARIQEFIDNNPGRDVSLPATDLNAIIDHCAWATAQNPPKSTSELIDRSLYAADSNLLTRWANQRFAVSGTGSMDGIHQGSTINYLFQGLLTSECWRKYQRDECANSCVEHRAGAVGTRTRQSGADRASLGLGSVWP